MFWDANGTTNDPVTNVTTALDMQRYITAFVATGDPNAFQKETGLIASSKYGSEAIVVNLNLTFVDVVVDPIKNSRYAAFSFIGHVSCLRLILVRRENVVDVVYQVRLVAKMIVFVRSRREKRYFLKSATGFPLQCRSPSLNLDGVR
jgi:hypothetical protein